MTYIIRESVPHDKEELLRLFDQFGEYLVDIDDLNLVIKADGYAEYFYASMISKVSNTGKIYVAEQGNTIVGFIAGSIKESSSVESPLMMRGRVEELFISEESRGLGVGKALMNKMEEFFKKSNCKVVTIEVFAPNKNAYRFYKTLGYGDRNIDLIKVLQ